MSKAPANAVGSQKGDSKSDSSQATLITSTKMVSLQNDDNKQFVSRGGIKLQAAIKNWKLRIENLVCLDVGSSTGGFVDCLLQNGAKKVYSVDTAYGELAWKLRNDPRVVVMERTNILHLESLPSPVIARSPPAGGRRSNLQKRLLRSLRSLAMTLLKLT